MGVDRFGPASTGGVPITHPLNDGIETSRGTIPDRTSDSVQAFISSSGTAEEDVWAQTGILVPRQSAIAMDITSSSLNDDGAPTTNTGMQTITVEGLDASFNAQTATYTLNGTSTVTTAETWTRINTAYGATFGTYHGSNEGAITIRDTGGGNIQALIPIGVGTTQKSHFTVPAGLTAYMLRFDLNVDSAKTSIFRLYSVENADDVTQPFTGGKILRHRVDGISGPISEILKVPLRFPEKTDIWWTVEAGAANTDIHVDYDIVFVAN